MNRIFTGRWGIYPFIMLLLYLGAACSLVQKPTPTRIPTPRPPTRIPDPTATGPPAYHWERFDVAMTVLINGDLRVVERQRLHFSGRPFTYGYRHIPVQGPGREYTITDVSVSQPYINYGRDTNQQPYTFRVDEADNAAVIGWFFPESIGAHSYEFRYTVLGAVQRDDQGDMLLWPVIPASLDERIETGEVLVTLPLGAKIQSTTALYDGQENPIIIQSAVSEDRQQAIFTLNAARPAGVEIVVGVRFPAGVVQLVPPEPYRALVDPVMASAPGEKGYRPVAVEYFEHGLDYFVEGEFELAIDEFSHALAAQQNFTEAYYYRGIAHYLNGDKNQANQDFDRAVALDPQLAEKIELLLSQLQEEPAWRNE